MAFIAPLFGALGSGIGSLFGGGAVAGAGAAAGGGISFGSMLGFAGTALSAVGSIAQGNAAADAAEFNAIVADQNASRERSEAAARAEASLRRSRIVLGRQRAGIAQSGFEASGSFRDLAEKSEANADLDALVLAYEGESAGRRYNDQASLYRAQGENARTAGWIGAGTSLLTGASRAYGRSSGLSLAV